MDKNFQFSIFNFQSLHHANIILGGDEILGSLKESLKKAGFDTRGNPDYLEYAINPFGVDEARELTLWAYGKPIALERKVAIIVTKSITHEAQNALLKTLEEPTPGTYFFLILENVGEILGTLLSRVRIMREFSKQNEIAEAATKFSKLPIADKVALIKNLSKSEDKEPMKDIIKDLESVMYKNSKNDLANDLSGNALKIKRLLLAKKFARQRGSSPKMLLEWLVATM